MVIRKKVLYAVIVLVSLMWICLSYIVGNYESEELIQTRELYKKLSEAVKFSSFYGNPELMNNLSVEYFRGRSKKITKLDFKFLITSNICSDNRNPLLIILVLSVADNFKQRRAIRETYGSVVRGHLWPNGDQIMGPVKLVFLFGYSNSTEKDYLLKKESEAFGDIVQIDFKESYFNLTYKVLMGFKWVKNYCSGAANVMKIDEDTFLDVPRLTNLMKSADMTNIIYGHFHYSDVVDRKEEKTKVSVDAFPLKYYLPHVKGNIYFMSKDLALQILGLAEYFPYINIEDAHITGTLPKFFATRHLNIPDDQYNPYGGPNVCDFALQKKIAAQQVDFNLAYEIWKRIGQKSLCS